MSLDGQALSRFFVGAMLQTNPVLEVIRRELRRVSPDVRIDIDQIKEVLLSEVIKREVIEGEKAEEARKKIAKAAAKALRASNLMINALSRFYPQGPNTALQGALRDKAAQRP